MMRVILASFLVCAACAADHVAEIDQAVTGTPACVDVTTYVGCGTPPCIVANDPTKAATNRASIQAVLDAASVAGAVHAVCFPPGEYFVARPPANVHGSLMVSTAVGATCDPANDT